MGTLFSASRGAHLLFSSNWARLLNNVAVRGSQWACYLPSLSQYPFIHLGREDQVRVRVPCSRTQNVHGIELIIFRSWVRRAPSLNYKDLLCQALIMNVLLTAHNWQKWKSTFFTGPCHEIYRVEAVCLKSFNYT